MIYLAGKLSGWVWINTLIAWWWSRKLWKRGYIVYSPHLNSIAMTNLLTWKQWMLRDFKVIDHCTEVWLLPNWKESKGAKLEYEYAKKQGKKIVFVKEYFKR